MLGTAQRQAGRVKEALLAFLHVDILYPGVPDAHAEALANLAELWDQVHKGERANRARQTLQEQYKDSPWAKKAGNEGDATVAVATSERLRRITATYRPQT